jgi:prepilin-type N-terminal cleavage/methylation domain-containing protein
MNPNQSGFSLIEVMVSVGLMGALGYVMMNQSDMSAKQQAKASFNQQVNSLVSSVQNELSRSENCSATLSIPIPLTYGTVTAPTVVNEIRRGRLDLTTTPPQVRDNGLLFKIRAENSNGVYIDSIHLIRRPGDNRKVLRLSLKPGSISATGEIREKDILGGDVFFKDILLSPRDNGGNTVLGCHTETSNLLASSCMAMPGGTWNETTQTCDTNDIVVRGDLVQLWLTKDGFVVATKPANVEDGEVTCQKSSKRCNRTDSDCTLPACPPNHYQGPAWEWDRTQSTWDKACMKSAKCIYVSQPAGWMVKP